MVRTWSIQSFSLITLKGLLMKYLSATATAAKAESAGETEGGDPAAQLRDSRVHSTGAATQLAVAAAAAAEEADASNPFASAGGALNFGFGAMAISPITLLHEWKAHSSPFISRKPT